MSLRRAFAQGLEDRRQLRPLRLGERRRHPQLVQAPVGVEEPQDHRADERPRAVLVPAKARENAVHRAFVLHLDHRALARLVAVAPRLRDDAVEPRALEALEPLLGDGSVVGDGGDVHRSLRVAEDVLQQGAALLERGGRQVFVAEREQVPQDDGRRGLLGQHRDAGVGRVDSLLQGLEVEDACAGDDQLAVENAAVGQGCLEGSLQLGEVAQQGLAVPGLEVQLVAVAEHEDPKPVPLRLVQPPVACGDARGSLRQHGFDGRLDRQRRLHGWTPRGR